jgi:uncharacterized protein (TIGR04255 family)
MAYTKTFLHRVIARLDFVEPIDALRKEMKDGLRDEILKMFPIYEPSDVRMKGVELSPQGVSVKDEEHKEWSFWKRDRRRSCKISHNALIVEALDYDQFEPFRHEFMELVSRFKRHFGGTVVQRLGLRFINVIELPTGDPFDWNDLLHPNLTASLAFPIDEYWAIVRCFQNLELKIGEHFLRMQFGMHNPDYPSIIKTKHFVLDYDDYVNGTIGSVEEVGETLSQAGRNICRLFELSIQDSLREIMNSA